MSEATSSLELYNTFAKEHFCKGSILEKEDIELLLELIRYELVISGNSHLLDIAYLSCRAFFLNHRMNWYKFEPSYVILSESGRCTPISAFDAWWIIILLSEYMSNGLIETNINRLLPCFFGSYVPQKTDSDELFQTLRKIDSEIRLHREKMYKLYMSEVDDDTFKSFSNHAASDANRERTKLSSVAEKTYIVKDKDAIFNEVRKQAGTECQKTLDDAHKEAERIVEKASLEAEKKISVARKKCIEMVEDSRDQVSMAEQQLFQQGFSDVRIALLQANEMIKKLEDTVSESSIQKISDQFLELFNLIADTKESTMNLARKNNDQDLENTAYNMDVFLDMIIEYMDEYGIQAIVSAPGDKFSPKYHTIGTSSKQFDPRKSSVKVSKRIGFIWGEQVLQKEKVEI